MSKSTALSKRGARRWTRAVAAACAALVLGSAALPPAARAQTTEADVFVADAIVKFEDKQYDAALANLRRALELEPDHVEALYFTGAVLMAQSKPADAIPFLVRARARARTDPVIAFQLGLAHFALQQYDQADPLLEEAFRRQPSLDGAGYYVGFLRYRKKDYRGALEALRSGQTSSPELQQLTRFYSGLALSILGLPAQASAEIEQAVRTAPSSALTGPVERLRETIAAARDRQRRLTLEARAGVFYDDNVSVIPDADLNEPLVPLLRNQEHASIGELFGVRAEYAWLRTDRWEATAGYSFFTTYNNDLPEFNIMSHLGTLGVTYKGALGAMPAQAGLQYAFDMLYLDGDQFLRRHTASLSGVLVESDRHLTQAFVRYQNKAFSESPGTPVAEIRDGDNYTIGALHLVRFAEDRHFVKLGYQFDWEDTTGRNYAYTGHRIVAGAQYTLPWWGIRLRYDLDLHLRDYLHRNTILPTTPPAPGTKERRDAELTNILRAELPLPQSLTLSAEYQSTINDSNIAIFQYTRNVVSLILTWSY
jgi:tetratricopeptide (TPR) repeat protein